MSRKIHLSLILISSAVIAYQIILMEIFSITQWHHFAFMIISLSMLGFGAAGTLLSLRKDRFLERKDLLIPLSMILSALFVSLSTSLSQLELIGFDTYLVFADTMHIAKLIFTSFLIFMPFFLAAFSIGLIFTAYSEDIGRIYFSNLLGSGTGGIIALLFLYLLNPELLATCVSLLAMTSGLLLIDKPNKRIVLPLAIIGVVVLSLLFIFPVKLNISQYKSISKTLQLPDAEIVLAKNSPFGFIQVVKSNYLRYAPGLSLTYTGEIPVRQIIFNNGDWAGPLISANDGDSNFVLDFTTNALVYRLAVSGEVLVLEAGTGEEVIHSLRHDPKHLTAVEHNSSLNSIILNDFAGEYDSIYIKKNVTLKEFSSRTFLNSDSEFYDIILLPQIGSFGGTSGVEAVKEEYLLTAESFELIYERLKPRGYYSVTIWLDYPYRNSLKLLETILTGLSESGIEDPEDHIIAVRSWGTVSFIVKKTGLTDSDILKAREFCKEMYFDPLIIPGVTAEERNNYNKLQDARLFDYIDTLMSRKSKSFIEDYSFRVSAPDDEKPYFFQFMNPSKINSVIKYFGSGSLPFFELGYLIVILTFIILVALSLVFIIIPLTKLGWRSGNKGWTLVYFSGLGLGYMFIEIVFIQKFILYFGNPIFSASAVITLLLICSGIGSFVSSKVKYRKRSLINVTAVVLILLLIYNFVLDPIIGSTVHFPFGIKLFSSVFIIGIPGFFMGMPFPMGIGKLHNLNRKLIPWAWGINGCLSVVSTALATIISVEFGFSVVLLSAAAAYGLASVVSCFSD